MKLRLISGLFLAMACMPSFQVTAKSENKKEKMPAEDVIILYLKNAPVIKQTAAAIQYVKTNYAKTSDDLMVGAACGALGGCYKWMINCAQCTFKYSAALHEKCPELLQARSDIEYSTLFRDAAKRHPELLDNQELDQELTVAFCVKKVLTGALVGSAVNLIGHVVDRCLNTIENDDDASILPESAAIFSGGYFA